MENDSFLLGHIEDLINKTIKSNSITSTFFLSLSQQSLILKEFSSLMKKYGNKIDLILDGGNKEENDRKILFIKPANINNEELNNYIFNTISLLYVEPKNKKYSNKLTHRDFLGSLMNLGIKREVIGDIFLNSQNENEGIIYCLSSLKEEILNNLTKIKDTNVIIKEINLNNPPFKMNFEYISIYVSSLRLDNVIKEVFNLSRETSKEIITKENVFINGVNKISPSYMLKKDDRVSIKGKGKFIFLDETIINKKGRYHTKIKKYS